MKASIYQIIIKLFIHFIIYIPNATKISILLFGLDRANMRDSPISQTSARDQWFSEENSRRSASSKNKNVVASNKPTHGTFTNSVIIISCQYNYIAPNIIIIMNDASSQFSTEIVRLFHTIITSTSTRIRFIDNESPPPRSSVQGAN